MGGIKREACDKWFSDCVRHRDGHTCLDCGKTEGQLDCAHIYGRAKKSTRWSMDNAVTLCRGCHMRHTEHPIAFHDWLVRLWGEGHMNLLREKAGAILKTNKILRKEISDHYRGEIRRAEADPAHEIVSWN